MAHKREKARQGAAVPYRWTPFGTLEVLLVSTRSGRWTLPKGGIKKGCNAREAARRESLEEAGILGRLEEPPLGYFSCKKGGRKALCQAFALQVTHVLERWEEDEERLRAWVSISEAPSFLKRESQARLVRKLHQRLLLQSQATKRLSA